MFEEEEKNEKITENNPDKSTIIQINDDVEKNERNNNDNIIDENNYEEKNITNNNAIINKSHHSKKISLDNINRISNSIFTISIPTNRGKQIGTCFFMCINDKKYLITSSHIIPCKTIKPIQLINNNGKKFYISYDFDKRVIKYFPKPFDILAIDILEKDKLNNITYLEYVYDDMNNYINKEICVLHHPEGKKLHLSCGTINKIDETIYEFEHNLDTDYGSSGSPVILIENCKVIGIHKKRIKESDNKKGTFIFKLIEKINGKPNISPNFMNLNKLNYVNEINDNSNNQSIGNNLLILKYSSNIEDPIMLFSLHFFKRFFNRHKNKLN